MFSLEIRTFVFYILYLRPSLVPLLRDIIKNEVMYCFFQYLSCRWRCNFSNNERSVPVAIGSCSGNQRRTSECNRVWRGSVSRHCGLCHWTPRSGCSRGELRTCDAHLQLDGAVTRQSITRSHTFMCIFPCTSSVNY